MCRSAEGYFEEPFCGMVDCSAEWLCFFSERSTILQNGLPFFRMVDHCGESPNCFGPERLCKSPFDGSLDGSCFSTPMLTESSHWRLADYLPCPWAVQVQMTPYWRRAHYFGRPFCTTVRRPTVLHNGRPILQNGRFTTWVLTYILAI